MPVSGLVLTLSEDPAAKAAALAALARDPRIEIGQPQDRRVPIVVETRDSDEDKDVWHWLHSLEGVQFVEVACIHFDEEDAQQQNEVSA